MPERFRILSEGDLEALTIAETQRLLSEVFGPYCFTVSGERHAQQAVFPSPAHHVVFVTYIHELVASSTDIMFEGSTAGRNLSLLDAGLWLIDRYPEEASRAGWSEAATALSRWMGHDLRVRFWSGELWRHVEFRAPFAVVFSAHANLIKHGLLKSGPEVNRLRRLTGALTQAEAVAALPEYSAHLQGMMEYYATQIAEYTGKYFHGLYKFVRARWQENPTNNLDLIAAPSTVTDQAYRYLYASTLFRFSQWTEERILSSIPETASSFKPEYPQRDGPDPKSG